MPTVLIPFKPGISTARTTALHWVVKQYRERHPNWRIRIDGGSSDLWWSKGEAVWKLLQGPMDSPVIVADADSWTTGIPSAVLAVASGAASWAIPHERVLRLTEGATAELLEGGEVKRLAHDRSYVGRRGGGFVVAHQSTLKDVPMDPRFIGWGQEDESWDYALSTLAGEPWRGSADLLHLWHPPPERADRRRGTPDGWRLMKRYRGASHDPAEMKRLVEEAKGCLSS